MTDDRLGRIVLRGRPRSAKAHQKILDAALELIAEGGFAQLRLEHVATRAGVGKATIYRRWRSKEALALELLLQLAAPHLAIEDVGDTRAEMRAGVLNASTALRTTSFGPLISGLLSEIAVNPALGDPFRLSVVERRRAQIAAVIERGKVRGDIRADADADLATELLVGPVYFRLVFGGELDDALADALVDAVLRGYRAETLTVPGSTTDR